MHVTAHLDVDLVALESDDAVTCLLQLQAPLLEDTTTRTGQTLVVCLDRSGSMSGGPLDAAVTALRSLLRRLAPQDRFGLVVFDDQAQLVVPLRAIADHDLDVVDALIASVRPGGSTDLDAGYRLALREATRVLRQTASDSAMADAATVLLVSDGHANAGECEPLVLRDRALRASVQRHITTATIGLGLGYDEVLLAAIADGGSGGHVFAEGADDLPAAIATEVDGLLDKSALNVTLRVTGRGSHLTGVGVIQGLPFWREDDTTVVALGDLYAGEVRKPLLRLEVASIPSLGLTTIADVVVEYTALPQQADHAVRLPISVNVVPGDVAAQRVPMPEVVVEVALAEAASAKSAAAAALRDGDPDAARTALTTARSSLASLNQALDVLRRHGRIDHAQAADLAAALTEETATLADLADGVDDAPAALTSKRLVAGWVRGRRGPRRASSTSTSNGCAST